MQTNPERFNKGVVHAAGDIISKEGVGFLLAGLGPTVVGYGLEGALKFGFYETFKKIFDHAKVTPYTALNFMLASVVAGAIASIVLVSVLSNHESYPYLALLDSVLWKKQELRWLVSLHGLKRMLSQPLFV